MLFEALVKNGSGGGLKDIHFYRFEWHAKMCFLGIYMLDFL